MPSLDPAICAALSLDSQTSSIHSHGHAGSSTSWKITARATNGDEQNFFVKTGPSAEMFESEHTSLNAIHASIPSFCPRSFAYGPLTNAAEYFLATEFLDMGSRHGPEVGTGTGLSFAVKLATLHSTPAPTPPGHIEPMFGFPVTTFCGTTPQDNSYRSSWADFYAENRLRGMSRIIGERHGGASGELRGLIERTAQEVVPGLLGVGHLGGLEKVVPVLVHGDLWSGNRGMGRIGGQEGGGAEQVVFDPSACWAHSEYELGIMQMFGGFGVGEKEEYHRLVPRTEPVAEYEDRVRLYELYHHLNHYAMFGVSYKSGAMGIMKTLLGKFGGA